MSIKHMVIFVILWVPEIMFAQGTSPFGLKPEKEASTPVVKIYKVGDIAPNFQLKDRTGSLVELYSYRGKYVFLDFWASWCGPCRAEHPYIVAAYKKHKDENFTVLSVTTDREENKDKWIQAVRKDNLTWPQLADFDQVVSKLYLVTKLPRNYLIDPTGKIISINLKGINLEGKLTEILKKTQ